MTIRGTRYTHVMKSFAPLAAALLASSFVAVAQAPVPPAPDLQLPPQYEVELLVFANRSFDPSEERFDQSLSGFAGDAEALREVPVFDDTNFGPLAEQLEAEPLPVDPVAAQRAAALSIRPLLPSELKLNTEYRKLQAIAAYEPLVHVGWLQPGLPEADAQPFDLKMLGILNPSGTVRVHLSRFLHITLDLSYQADAGAAPVPVASDGLDELVFAPRYHLQATRSARSGELHYFDHPAFGALVRVTPVPAQNDAQGRRPTP
jgi:hypothetical protein